jgi:hypothetical protein
VPRRIIITLLSLFVFAVGAWAQAPDLRPYRHLFVAITADRANQQGMTVDHIMLPGSIETSHPVPVDPNGGPSERQAAYLKNTGLSDDDAAIAEPILAKFRTQYDTLVDEYNNLPETLAGSNASTPAFLTNLDRLTQSTKDALSSSLSFLGATQLDTFVRQLHIDHGSNQSASNKQTGTFKLAGFHASPQSGCSVTGHYDSSITFSIGSPPPYQIAIYNTVLVEGYATTSGNCTNELTRGFARGQFIYDCYTETRGPYVSPATWISVSNVLEAVGPFGPTVYTTGEYSAVIYSTLTLPPYALNNVFFQWEVAFTRFVTAGYLLDTSSAPYHRDYLVGPYCTAPTTPPDWNPPSPPFYYITLDPPGVPTGVVDGKTLCDRFGGSGQWKCLPFGEWLTSYDAPYFTGNCTRNP